MLILTLLSIGGLIAGLLLLRTVPVVTAWPPTTSAQPSRTAERPTNRALRSSSGLQPAVRRTQKKGALDAAEKLPNSAFRSSSGLQPAVSHAQEKGASAPGSPVTSADQPFSAAYTAPETCCLRSVQRLPSITIIIPARNEATNLPPLLESLRHSAIAPSQILAVDDGSTDNTSAIAIQHGATVIASAPLPAGWTGKTWACHQGALAATGDALFFLDADTYFTPTGYTRIVEHFATLPPNTALSLLPFHRTQLWYEELSLFFNILVAMGAGGFGKLDPPHLFGQSLLIPRDLYNQAGGHHSVKREILENLHFSELIRTANGIPATLSGRGSLEMRMFPHGLTQLRESWQKAFSTGAGVTSPLVLALSIYWLAAAMLTALLLAAIHNPLWSTIATLYLLNAIQIAWYARQLGTFRWITALLYPIPLAFYFVTFAQSIWRQTRRQPVTWRGRQL